MDHYSLEVLALKKPMDGDSGNRYGEDPRTRWYTVELKERFYYTGNLSHDLKTSKVIV